MRSASPGVSVVTRGIVRGDRWDWSGMARAIWTGVITFGLVSVPVSLFTAIEDHTVHFHQLQRGTSDRTRNRRVNERTGDEVSSEDIVKGFEVSEGEYVVVEPDKLDEIAPGRSQTIDITDFVDLDAIEPVYFDRTSYIDHRPQPSQRQRQERAAAAEQDGATRRGRGHPLEFKISRPS